MNISEYIIGFIVGFAISFIFLYIGHKEGYKSAERDFVAKHKAGEFIVDPFGSASTEPNVYLKTTGDLAKIILSKYAIYVVRWIDTNSAQNNQDSL